MRFPHSLVLAACITLLPVGTAVGQGAGSGGSAGAGTGGAGAAAAGDGRGGVGVGTSAGSGSATIGGDPPAGAVGGGAAGPRGGGAPTDSATPASPAANPPTTGGVIGGYTGVGKPPGTNNNDIGGTHPSPPISGQTQSPAAPAEVRGVAEQSPGSTTGLAKPTADGIGTRIVPARPCSTFARETDGTTTCVGIPAKR